MMMMMMMIGLINSTSRAWILTHRRRRLRALWAHILLAAELAHPLEEVLCHLDLRRLPPGRSHLVALLHRRLLEQAHLVEEVLQAVRLGLQIHCLQRRRQWWIHHRRHQERRRQWWIHHRRHQDMTAQPAEGVDGDARACRTALGTRTSGVMVWHALSSRRAPCRSPPTATLQHTDGCAG